VLDLADISLLLVLAAVALLVRAYTLHLVARHAKLAEKYKLFAARDAFIRLVAEEKLQEDDPVFQVFYKASNFLVQNTEEINLGAFVAALEEARRKGVDPAVEAFMERIHDAARKNPDVKGAVDAFYKAIQDILFRNSWVLRLLLRCRPLLKVASRFGGKRTLPTQQRAVLFYQDYSRAAEQVAA
jgi:hypothetical protein